MRNTKKGLRTFAIVAIHILSILLHSSISWLVLRPKAWVDYFNFRSKERLHFTKNIKLTHKIKNPNIPQAQISRIKIVKHESSSLRRELIQGFPQQPWLCSNQSSGHSEWEKDISSAFICMNNFFAGLMNTSHSWIIQILKSIHIWCWFSLTTQSSSLIQRVVYHSHNSCSLNMVQPKNYQNGVHLNLNPLHLDPPGPGGLVEDVLHEVADHLPLGQDLRQCLQRSELLPCSQTEPPFLIL